MFFPFFFFFNQESKVRQYITKKKKKSIKHDRNNVPKQTHGEKNNSQLNETEAPSDILMEFLRLGGFNNNNHDNY